jgi:hypothetical protein
MKTALLALVYWLVFNFGGNILAKEEYPDPSLPRPDMVGNWDEISERMMKWEIVEFDYSGMVLDGGSLNFNFKTADGSEFDVLVACPAWWTKEDWKEKQQPIFLDFQNKSYRVSKGGESEKRLLLMLSQAASKLKGLGRKRPIYIKRLHDIVKSRARRDDYWPFGELELNGASGNWTTRVNTLRENNLTFDRLDLEGASGDWSKIQETFKKWKIVEFNEWDTLGDGSTIFRFTTSDDSKIGILVPTILPHYPHADDPFEVKEPIVFPQVIFLHFKRQLYCVEKGGETETILLEMLNRAANELKGEDCLHSKYIKCLSGVVKSRTFPPYNSWPFDQHDLEAEQDGAGQPATAPLLKSESKDKPQPESEVRPR